MYRYNITLGLILSTVLSHARIHHHECLITRKIIQHGQRYLSFIYDPWRVSYDFQRNQRPEVAPKRNRSYYFPARL
ncbi:hypothetical protein DFH07DRAFT_796719, partial [Mycena maculata]